MSTRADRLYTAEEYLAIERASEHKSEFVNGRIYAMTGASIPHTVITGNLFGELRNRLRGGPCRAYVEGIRVKVSQTGMYAYPDVVAHCYPPAAEDAHQDTLLNPAVIFEVYSDETEAFDRVEKFIQYRRSETLQEYILVSQSEVRVERFVRIGDRWRLDEFTAPTDVLRIETLGCEISLSEIYDRVDFPHERMLAKSWARTGA